LLRSLVSVILLFNTVLTFSYADPSTPTCEIQRPIVFGGLDWESNTFHVEVAKFILEHGYGCETDVIPGSSLPILTALGRGDIDVMMEVWAQNIQEVWNQLLEDKKAVKAGVNFPDAVQGFYVPSYLVHGDESRNIEPFAPKLTSVKQLGDYWQIFKDPEQPDKGRFYNCILGWTCETLNTKKLTVYGLDEFYVNFRPGAGAALATAISSSYKRGIPFVAYYWGPTWVLGQFDLVKLKEPAYQKDIWEAFVKDKYPSQTTAYPDVEVLTGLNYDFAQKAPELVGFFSKYRTTNSIVSKALAFTQTKEGRTPKDAAIEFLKTKQDVWSGWVDPEKTTLIKKALGIEERKKPVQALLNIEDKINDFVKWLVNEHQNTFDQISKPIRSSIVAFEYYLNWIPWWILILVFAVLCFGASNSWILTVFVSGCLVLIFALGLWALSMQTLALMIISAILSLIIGIPIGILISQFDRIRTVVLPILDAMQTMPSFVYLIPALMLFGLGKVPAIFATVIYAVSPLIRLTDLGIRNVPENIVEAAKSFGATRFQLLLKVQLPLALPTIMAGINQMTMLALSMVVIASMIGARGLGEQVLLGIQKLDVGKGFTAGLAIVALAISLDRITQAFGRKIDQTK